MASSALTITLNAKPLIAQLAELSAIEDRRGSLKQFRDALLEISEGIPDGLEATWVDFERLPACAGKGVLSLHFGERLLSRLTALRALDRDFDV